MCIRAGLVLGDRCRWSLAGLIRIRSVSHFDTVADVDGAQTRPSYPTIPGPADRVLFDEMQARQRTAARRYAVLGVRAVALAGIPVSLVVTPLVFIFLLIGFRASAISGSAPPAAATLAHEITSTVHAALQSVLASEWAAIDARTLTL